VVEAVQLAPAPKKANLANLVDSVSLQDGEKTAEESVAKETSTTTQAHGPKREGGRRRVFKRLQVQGRGEQLTVKALQAMVGGEKRKAKRRGDKKKLLARHTLLNSARYQEGGEDEEAAKEEKAEGDEEWELLHMVDICREPTSGDSKLSCNGEVPNSHLNLNRTLCHNPNPMMISCMPLVTIADTLTLVGHGAREGHTGQGW